MQWIAYRVWTLLGKDHTKPQAQSLYTYYVMELFHCTLISDTSLRGLGVRFLVGSSNLMETYIDSDDQTGVSMSSCPGWVGPPSRTEVNGQLLIPTSCSAAQPSNTNVQIPSYDNMIYITAPEYTYCIRCLLFCPTSHQSCRSSIT